MSNHPTHFRILSILFVLAFALSIAPSPAARAEGRRYAMPQAVGTGDCLSWENACTLQTALSGAVSGDEIWVAEGVHTPTASPDREATFQLVDGVALYGGFDGTETLRQQRDPSANLAILSGDIDKDDSQSPVITDLSSVTGNELNSYHVVTGASGAILDGFTITAGNANLHETFPGRDCGGGLFNVDGSSPVLNNITFSGNLATLVGGGMVNTYGSNPILTNVTFHGNSASYGGGGMFNWGSSPILSGVTFQGNGAGNTGGGLYNEYGSHPVLTNVTFFANEAANLGGGMANFDSSPAITNATFSTNSALSGGGISNDYSSTPQVRNTILWGNLAEQGAQIYNGPFYSTAYLDHSLVQDGCPAGCFCTDLSFEDPLLGPLGEYGGLTLTLPLPADSPAVDAGDDSVCPPTDQRGIRRPQGAHCDLGAYEFNLRLFLPNIGRP